MRQGEGECKERNRVELIEWRRRWNGRKGRRWKLGDGKCKERNSGGGNGVEMEGEEGEDSGNLVMRNARRGAV